LPLTSSDPVSLCSCPLISAPIQVFGRHRELAKAVIATPPDAVLVPQPVADSPVYAKFSKALLGLRDKKVDEEYVLLSVNQKVDLDDLQNLAIGVVDLMSRGEMNAFITRKLTTKPKRIEQVVRLEDLLSLLQFQDVHAVFVSKQRVNDYYRKRSKMNLIDTSLEGVSVGLPILSTNTQNPAVINLLIENLKAINPELKRKLGVDAWTTP